MERPSKTRAGFTTDPGLSPHLQWTVFPAMNCVRLRPSLVVLNDQTTSYLIAASYDLVARCNSIECYSVDTRRWTLLDEFPIQESFSFVAAVM